MACGQGFLTVTFDYRGIGGSLHGKLRDVGGDLLNMARDAVPSCRCSPNEPVTCPSHGLAIALGGSICHSCLGIRACAGS